MKKYINGKEVFYQPIMSGKELEKHDLASFMVYRNYENAKQDFPDIPIGAFTEDDIENPTFIDEDDRTVTFYVDIPQEGTDEWKNIESFKNREDAIAFAQEKFGADENGMVSLISEIK